MNIHYVMFFCFLSGALCDGETGPLQYVQGAEGENITVECSSLVVEIGRMFFCKGECKNDFVRTFRLPSQKGRYSLESANSLLYARITQLMKSDEGRYTCGVMRPLFPNSYKEFEVIVTDGRILAPLESPDFPLVLVVCVTVVVVVLLAVLLLLLYRKKRKACNGLKKRGNSGCTQNEIVPCVNSPPLSPCEESRFQSLDPASRDPDQIYYTLTQTQHK